MIVSTFLGGYIYYYLQTYLLEDIHEAPEVVQSSDKIQEDPEDVPGVQLDPDVRDVQGDTLELMHL